MLRKRFTKEVSWHMKEFGSSLEADKEMTLEDIWGNEAHVIMLTKQGIIDKSDAKRILKALGQARKDWISGRLKLKPELEDVHMNIEAYVVEKVGDAVGGRIHTARSRNDQVVTDTRMLLRERILEVEESLLQLQKTLAGIAGKTAEEIMPGYTHTQLAQPITLGYWASAYASMLYRDQERLRKAYSTVNKSPLGACALAGTSLSTDRKLTAKLLGFDGVVEHALDAVSSRDFISETLAALALLMSNMSRLSEELILYSTAEYGIIELDEGYTTGSSIMPQKKNPDAAELVRGLTGYVYGALTQILVTLKGLPIGYNRDLQEGRVLLWGCIRRVNAALQVLDGAVSTARFNKERMQGIAAGNFSTATELANYLVSKGMPFRRAHEVTSEVVKELSRNGRDFRDLKSVKKILEKQGIDVQERDLADIIDPEKAVKKNRSLGGTSPREVKRMTVALMKEIKDIGADINKRRDKLKKAREYTEKTISEL